MGLDTCCFVLHLSLTVGLDTWCCFVLHLSLTVGLDTWCCSEFDCGVGHLVGWTLGVVLFYI